MLEYLVYVEEQEREDIKIEAFKAAVLDAFPDKNLYKELYSPNKDENEFKVIDVPVDEYTNLQDIMELLNSELTGTERDI